MGILQGQYFDGQYSILLFMNICPSFLYLLLFIYVLIFSIYTYILLSFKHILITHNSVKPQNISFSTFFVCFFFSRILSDFIRLQFFSCTKCILFSQYVFFFQDKFFIFFCRLFKDILGRNLSKEVYNSKYIAKYL